MSPKNLALNWASKMALNWALKNNDKQSLNINPYI
jgi:hypothetical protein